MAATAVQAGLAAVVMVQTSPLLGWLMWAAALALVGTLGFLWYRREVWKYHQADGNRYRLQIALENDLVVDWEQRG